MRPWRNISAPEAPGIGWGAVAVGAVAGISMTGIAALAVLVAGGATTAAIWPDVVLILFGFAGQFLAGFIAARAAGRRPALHGSAAGVAALAALAAIAVAAGTDTDIATLAFGFVAAGVIGAAGGVLAALR